MNYRQVVNAVGLVIGFASFYYEVLTPFWGVVFLFGTLRRLQAGKAALFFETSKSDAPILYWLLILLWLLIGFYFLLYPIW